MASERTVRLRNKGGAGVLYVREAVHFLESDTKDVPEDLAREMVRRYPQELEIVDDEGEAHHSWPEAEPNQ